MLQEVRTSTDIEEIRSSLNYFDKNNVLVGDSVVESLREKVQLIELSEGNSKRNNFKVRNIAKSFPSSYHWLIRTRKIIIRVPKSLTIRLKEKEYHTVVD